MEDHQDVILTDVLLDQNLKDHQDVILTDVLLDQNLKLGSGSTANVFQGTYLGNVVAIKWVNKSFLEDEELICIKKEISTMKSLRNTPNIVGYIGCHISKNPFYIIMELLKTTVHHITNVGALAANPIGVWLPSHYKINDKLLKFSFVVAMIRDATMGLRVLHEQGLIHRDIKSLNLLVDEKGVCKLGDLGLVKTLNGRSLDDTITSTNTCATSNAFDGTLPFMAPELLQAGVKHSQSSDVHSLILTLNEALSGERPYATWANECVRNAIIDKELPEMKHRVRYASCCVAEATLSDAMSLIERMIADTLQVLMPEDRMSANDLCRRLELVLETLGGDPRVLVNSNLSHFGVKAAGGVRRLAALSDCVNEIDQEEERKLQMNMLSWFTTTFPAETYGISTIDWRRYVDNMFHHNLKALMPFRRAVEKNDNFLRTHIGIHEHHVDIVKEKLLASGSANSSPVAASSGAASSADSVNHQSTQFEAVCLQLQEANDKLDTAHQEESKNRANMLSTQKTNAATVESLKKTHEAATQQLESRVRQVEHKACDLEHLLSLAQTQETVSRKAVVDLGARLQAQEASASNAQEQVKTHLITIQQRDCSIADMGASIASLTDTVTQNTTTIAGLTASATFLQSQLDTAQARVKELEVIAQAAKTVDVGADAMLSIVRAELTTVTAQLIAANNTAAQLAGQLTDSNESVAELTESINLKNVEIAQLRHHLTASKDDHNNDNGGDNVVPPLTGPWQREIDIFSHQIALSQADRVFSAGDMDARMCTRLSKDYREVERLQGDYFRLRLINDDLRVWQTYFKCPETSRYAGRVVRFDIKFNGYPMFGPIVYCKSNLQHDMINQEDDTVTMENWTPTKTMSSVISGIEDFLWG